MVKEKKKQCWNLKQVYGTLLTIKKSPYLIPIRTIGNTPTALEISITSMFT